MLKSDRSVFEQMLPVKTMLMRGSRGEDRGSPLPSEKSQNYRVPYQYTGLDPMKNHRDSMTAFNVGPPSANQRNAI